MALLSELVEFSYLLTDVVANVEFAIKSDNLVILLVLQGLLTQWIVAYNFAALSLVLFYFGEPDYGWAVRALDSEGIDDFFDHSGSSSNLDV